MIKRGRKIGSRSVITQEEREAIFEFSALVSRVRKEKSLSMIELARASGKHKQHIYEIENYPDTKSPNFTSVIRLLNVLGYKIQYVKK